jgi:hypothetical protein
LRPWTVGEDQAAEKLCGTPQKFRGKFREKFAQTGDVGLGLVNDEPPTREAVSAEKLRGTCGSIEIPGLVELRENGKNSRSCS